MNKPKKKIIMLIVISIVILGGIIGIVVAVTHKSKELDQRLTMEGDTVSLKERLDQFEENAKFKNSLLFGDELCFYSAPLFGYSDLKNNQNFVLCDTPGCKHNSEDCTANITNSGITKTMIAYHGKMYFIVGGQHRLFVYRSDFDGKNKEKLVDYDCALDDFANSMEISCLPVETGCYVAAVLRNEKDMKPLDNGILSDCPSILRMLFYEYETNQVKLLFDEDMGLYQQFARLDAFETNTLYFSVTGSNQPMDYTEDLLSPYTTNNIFTYDVESGSVERIEDISATGLIDIKQDTIYYTKVDCFDGEIYTTNGDVIAYNIEDKTSNTFQATEISDVAYGSFYVCRLEDKYAIWSKENGTYFYDFSGNQIEHIKDASYCILGENKDYYFLGDSGWQASDENSAYAYVSKSEVQQMNRKAKTIWE